MPDKPRPSLAAQLAAVRREIHRELPRRPYQSSAEMLHAMDPRTRQVWLSLSALSEAKRRTQELDAHFAHLRTALVAGLDASEAALRELLVALFDREQWAWAFGAATLEEYEATRARWELVGDPYGATIDEGEGDDHGA